MYKHVQMLELQEPFGEHTDESTTCELKEGTRKRARQPEQEILRDSGVQHE